MDAAVKPETRAMNAAKPGRIIVVRHGRPAVIPKEGPPMGWREYKAWWDKYELSSLKEGQSCPEALLKQIGDDAIILSSAKRSRTKAGPAAEACFSRSDRRCRSMILAAMASAL